MFAAASPIYIDSSKISPGTLEAIGRAAYINQKVNGFLPYLLGWVARFLQTYDGALRLTRRSWLDALFLGVVLFVFGIWVQQTRPTERLINKCLVVRAPLLALLVWSSSTDLL